MRRTRSGHSNYISFIRLNLSFYPYGRLTCAILLPNLVRSISACHGAVHQHSVAWRVCMVPQIGTARGQAAMQRTPDTSAGKQAPPAARSAAWSTGAVRPVDTAPRLARCRLGAAPVSSVDPTPGYVEWPAPSSTRPSAAGSVPTQTPSAVARIGLAITACFAPCQRHSPGLRALSIGLSSRRRTRVPPRAARWRSA